jgi:hypothetical protein
LTWRKLRNIERDSTIKEPTEARLFIDNENELQLHNIAKQILERHVSDIEDFRNGQDGSCCPELSDADRAIVEESTRLMFKRFWLLFDMFGKAFIYHDNPVAQMVFWSRFMWLVEEAQKYTEQSDAENEVMDAPDYFDLCAGEQDRRLKPVYDKWDNNLFSEKSFHDYIEKRWNIDSLSEVKPTPEELAEMDKEEQADREFDEKVLKEKCPSCPTPCEWYKREKKKRENGKSE